MEIPSPVEPCVVVERRHIDHQRIALPVAVRPTHPRIGGRFPMRIHVDSARSTLVLVDDQNLRRSLKNLKWKRHVVGARHARPITLEFRLAGVIAMRIVSDFHGHPFLEVLLLFCESFGTVRNFAALDDALSTRTGAPRTHDLRMRSGLRSVGENVPVRGREGLPNTIQVRFTVRSAGRRVSRE